MKLIFIAFFLHRLSGDKTAAYQDGGVDLWIQWNTNVGRKAILQFQVMIFIGDKGREFFGLTASIAPAVNHRYFYVLGLTAFYKCGMQ